MPSISTGNTSKNSRFGGICGERGSKEIGLSYSISSEALCTSRAVGKGDMFEGFGVGR